MSIVVFGLIALVALLCVTALAVPLGRRLGLPAPVLFAAIGLSYGIATSVLDFEGTGSLLDAYDMWFVEQLALDSQAMLYLFLPPLLFEMALAINARRLLDDVAVVFVMAVLAVVAATAAVGLMLWLGSGLGLVACLLLGAAVATTDPGAVISTFREIGAPKRLLVILEGESLLNDAAAIAIFALLLGLLRGQLEPSVPAVLLDFAYAFGTGAAAGLIIALGACWIYPFLTHSREAEVSLTVALAYGVFIFTEQVIGGSGVVAVVFAGLATGTSGFLRMGPGNWATTVTVWGQIGFWANAAIMMLATSLLPGMIVEIGWRVMPLVGLVFVAAMAARALILFGLLPLLAQAGLSAAIPPKQSLLALWGGVRGSVTLVLAITIADLGVLGEDAQLLAAIAATYTLVTIFLNAATLASLVRILGLNRLSATDLALRERIVAGSLERVRSVVGNLARARDLEPAALEAVERALRQQMESAEARTGDEHIPFGERLRLGLSMSAGQELRMVRHGFEEGAIGPRAAAALRLQAERIMDAVRTGGREGYQIAVQEALAPSVAYRNAVRIHRLLRIDGPLRQEMELHITGLLETERIVRQLRDFIAERIAPMIGEDAARNLSELMRTRHEAVEAEIEAVSAQYPRYATELERMLIARAAIRRERQQYIRLRNDGVIETELQDDLLAGLDRREREVARPPRLDLSVTPAALIDRLPIFADLSDKQRRMLSKVLRPRFTIPGERILMPGERRTEMFFIASGALEIEAGGTARILCSGEFFGELALIQPLRRRRSTVTSRGYCRLMVLRIDDLARLARRDETVSRLIKAAAERNLFAELVTLPGDRKEPLPPKPGAVAPRQNEPGGGTVA